MRRTTPDQARIIELFAQRRPGYTRDHAARLLGISETALLDAITSGTIALERNDRGMEVLSWEDVALLALEEWTPRMIEAALGTTATAVIPPLNQHRLIRVSLPIYLIRLMDYLARFESTTHRMPRNASDIIEQVLHEYASTYEFSTLHHEIPEFERALQYPYYIDEPTGTYRRCRYCGITISEPAREVCLACEARHEPDEHRGNYDLPELEQDR